MHAKFQVSSFSCFGDTRELQNPEFGMKKTVHHYSSEETFYQRAGEIVQLNSADGATVPFAAYSVNGRCFCAFAPEFFVFFIVFGGVCLSVRTKSRNR